MVSIGGAPASSDEGTPISLTSSVVDPGAETLAYDWQVTKDGTAYASGTSTTLDFTPDDNGTYQVLDQPFSAPGDRRVRRLFTTTVSLKNMVGN